jgi:hypothetical protein
MNKKILKSIHYSKDRKTAFDEFFKSHPLIKPDNIVDIKYKEKEGFSIYYEIIS